MIGRGPGRAGRLSLCSLTLAAVSFALTSSAQPPEGPARPLKGTEPKWKTTRPMNALPNPYRRDANWAQLPEGLKWGAVIGMEPALDGSLYVVHRCFENSCAGRNAKIPLKPLV